MKIAITSQHNFRQKVTARKPADGGSEDIELEVEYRCLPEDKLKELDTDHEVMAKAVVQIHGSIEVDSKPLTGDELKAALGQIRYIRNAIVRHYLASIGGSAAGN